MLLLVWSASLVVALPRAGGAPARSSIPIATSFIYPIGNGSIQPTWDPNGGNGYYITQGFNTSCDPSLNQGFYMYGLYYCGHTGVDLASSSASSVIHATANGMVVSSGYNGSYGVMVRIQHILPDGSSVYSQYEHLAYGSLAVYVGEIVTQGQEIGLVGATGFATGPHLHFEIKSVNEDGPGYTFGNASLIAGYFDPLSFVAAHQAFPTTTVTAPGPAQPMFPAESNAILRTFLKSYRHFVVVSTGEGLRVRTSPSLHGKVLGVALRGAKLGYLQTRGVWIKVALPQKVTGWVDRKYVAGYQDWGTPLQQAGQVNTAVTAWPPAGPVAVVDPAASVGLNVRSAPGQNHQVISAVFEGDKLAVLGFTANWEHVRTQDGTRGWVLRRYLDQVGSRAALAAHTITAAVPVLNVRSGPGLQYGVTGAVYRGVKMTLVRTTPHWGAVILPGGTVGWVALPMTTDWPLRIGLPSSPATPATDAADRQVFITVTAGVLNIRSGPGQNHPVIAEVLRKTDLQVIDTTAHWAHVALPASSIHGWVLLRYTR
jgi:murein DD-endopeptidase MepM/ murein hydrolase activator NlpD/SH3-like domain-containing protein